MVLILYTYLISAKVQSRKFKETISHIPTAITKNTYVLHEFMQLILHLTYTYSINDVSFKLGHNLHLNNGYTTKTTNLIFIQAFLYFIYIKVSSSKIKSFVRMNTRAFIRLHGIKSFVRQHTIGTFVCFKRLWHRIDCITDYVFFLTRTLCERCIFTLSIGVSIS